MAHSEAKMDHYFIYHGKIHSFGDIVQCVNLRAVKMKFIMHIANGTTHSPNYGWCVVGKVRPKSETNVCYCKGGEHDRNNKYVLFFVEINLIKHQI